MFTSYLMYDALKCTRELDWTVLHIPIAQFSIYLNDKFRSNCKLNQSEEQRKNDSIVGKLFFKLGQQLPPYIYLYFTYTYTRL